MKKRKLFLSIGSTIAIMSVGLVAQNPILEAGNMVYAAENTSIDVTDINQFVEALKNPNITNINVVASISFTKNITDIPNRDVTINGNSNLGVVINSGIYSIYGKQNYKGRNTFTVKNANIVGDQTVGRFFTGGAGNGPSSYGWDVYAEDITYEGARLFHLSEGKLTFGGVNNINTRCENAWVHDLEFLPNTVYNSRAANKDHGQFSAFYFNGALINGKANGEVKIGNSAQINVYIGAENSNINYYYPVFYDKVQKVDVGESATLNVDAAGVAFQFIPRADYAIKNPQLNLAEGSTVNLNGRGGGNYSTMKLQYYGTQINAAVGSTLNVTGNSKKSVIESEYKGANINLDGATFMVENKNPNSKLFYSTDTTIAATNVSGIQVWNQTGGDYPDAETTYKDGYNFNVNFGKICNSKINSLNGDIAADFNLPNYGKLLINGGGN